MSDLRQQAIDIIGQRIAEMKPLTLGDLMIVDQALRDHLPLASAGVVTEGDMRWQHRHDAVAECLGHLKMFAAAQQKEYDTLMVERAALFMENHMRALQPASLAGPAPGADGPWKVQGPDEYLTCRVTKEPDPGCLRHDLGPFNEAQAKAVVAALNAVPAEGRA